MAWIYLAESEDSHLPWQIGSDRSPIVKMTDTPRPFCFLGWPDHNCLTHLSGMRSGPCVPRQYLQSISSTEVFPARTLALQEMEKAWQESEADFSTKLSGLHRKYRPASSSSKMSLQFELVDWIKCFGHLPIFGMTVDGRVYLPQKLEPRILEKDGSYWPTPTAAAYGSNQGGGAGRKGVIRHSLDTMARKNLWPTPLARDWKARGGKNRHSKDLPTSVGGQLNPQFVEWLMGFPSEWTELNAWATPSYLYRRGSRSKGLSGSKRKND